MSSVNPSQNVVMIIDFTDQQGNLLPQFEINAVVSYNDYVNVSNLTTNGYSQVLNQIRFRLGSTPDSVTNTGTQVYQQIVNAMNQIATLPANAGAGTTQTSNFTGQIQGENVIFDLVAGNGLTLNRVILSGSDYTLLVSNAQSNVAVTNVSSTTSPANLTYDRLETQIQLSGVTSIPSSQSAGLTNTQNNQNPNYSVIVQNNQKQTQTFILSQSDYVNLYSTQLNSIVSSQQTSAGVNATLSNVLNFIVSTPVQTPVLSPENGATNIIDVQAAYQTVKQTVTQAVTVAANSGVISQPAADQAIQAVNNLPATNTIPQNTADTINTALQHSVNQGIIQQEHAQTVSNLISGTISPNPLTGKAKQFNSLAAVKSDPIGFAVTIFTGLFAGSLIMDSKAAKHLRSHKRSKR